MSRAVRRLRSLAAGLGAALLLSVILFRPAVGSACGWDQDTIWMDARYMNDVVSVLVGRFPRNPPLYYEMRLERTKKELAKDPKNLLAYDDAGVACDRLGRPAEAIEWMAKKKAQLDALPESPAKKEALYRYLANLGTFRFHLWLKQGAPRDSLSDVQRAKELLAEAVLINPDAHFGREKYQVLAMDWILAPKPSLEELKFEYHGTDLTWTLIPSFLGSMKQIAEREHLAKKYPDAARGLAGLIALGSSWESVDVFHNLAMVFRLLTDQPSLAAVASMRAWELLDAGKKTLYPYAPADPKSAIGFTRNTFHFENGRSLSELKSQFGITSYKQVKQMKGRNLVEKQYFAMLAEAEAWTRSRDAYLLAQLQAGKHPDTHPDFWAAWSEPPTPFITRVKASPQWNLLGDFDGARPLPPSAANKK